MTASEYEHTVHSSGPALYTASMTSAQPFATNLPFDFVTQIRTQLGPDANRFLATYNDPPTHGLRLNPAKIEISALRTQTGWNLEPIPWCPNGYYIDPTARPGSHPFHAAGLYYLQEPTAMAVAEAADLQPGQTVLDIAASPGGKSTQISAAIGPTGLLVANEIHPARIKALGENLERWGATNTIITNRTPAQIATNPGLQFDRIIIDAPCSGEGLFRRDPAARDEWSPDRVIGCSTRQIEIVETTLPLLGPGGLLVYSTCTFNQSENEHVITRLLADLPDFTAEPTQRYWPHECRGEGHTITCIHRSGTLHTPASVSSGSKPSPVVWSEFAATTFSSDPLAGFPGDIVQSGERLSLQSSLPLAAIVDRPVRSGLWLGDQRPGRFEPSHALALAIDPATALNRLDLTIADAHRWIAGEPINASGDQGWVLITVEGYGLGWGKRTGGTVKNHYPKGLRRPIPRP